MNIKLIKIVAILLFLSSFSNSQIIVSCVGNSITEDWMGNPSYVPSLQNMLGSDYSVLNLGKSNTTLLKNGDDPYWNHGVFTQALNSDADIITILLGTNDTKSQNWESHGNEFKSDYAALIDTLQSANKNATIFPVIPVPVCNDNYGIRNSVIEQQIPIIKDVADEKGLIFIDANTPLQQFCSYFTDGVHPNQSGADSIASIISRSIHMDIPSINLSPESDRIEMSGSTVITATLSNFETTPEIQWSVSGGSIDASTGNIVTFTPDGVAGTFTITATADTVEESVEITAFDPDQIHLRINCGGGEVEEWEGSGSYASGGESYDFGSPPSTAGLEDPAPGEVYQTVYHSAEGSHDYDFSDIPDGDYEVRLHFYDMHDGRTMAFTIEGEQVIEGYDPPESPEIKEFQVSVEDGNGLQINCESAGGSDVFISGIEIIRRSTAVFSGGERIINSLDGRSFSITHKGGKYLFDIQINERYRIDIVDMQGAVVQRFSGNGRTRLAWKPSVASGIYAVRLVAKNVTIDNHLIMVR